MTAATEATEGIDRRHAYRAPSRVPRGIVDGGTFADLDGLLGSLRALRATGATEDVLGFAIPLSGDPWSPEGLAVLPATQRKRRFDALAWLLDVIDPHRPPPDVATWRRGRNTYLARPVLGDDLWRWILGVYPFRVPMDDHPAGGVWILGRPNHASAVAGTEGAALGGVAGALSTLGVPAQYIATYGERLAAGDCLLTTCETDEGRSERDLKIMRKRGGQHLFKSVVAAERRVQA